MVRCANKASSEASSSNEAHPDFASLFARMDRKPDQIGGMIDKGLPIEVNVNGIERQTDWKHKKAKIYLIMSACLYLRTNIVPTVVRTKGRGTYKMSDLMKPQDQSHPHLDVSNLWICKSRSVTRKYFNQCLNRFLGAEE